jgi:hypothetical protein
MSKVILYSTDCPKCKILADKLDKEGVQYEVCTDVDLMQKKGFMSAPMLEVCGKTYDFTSALVRMREIVYNAEGEDK